MAEKIARLSQAGSMPQIEIIIGQAQFGTYDLYLWDAAGVNFELIGSGLNVDQVSDQFTINKPVAALNGMMATWEVKIGAFSSSPGQLYAVTIKITQDGQVVPGGQIVNSGALTGAIFVFDFVRFMVL
jgi:hypothetical protein